MDKAGEAAFDPGSPLRHGPALPAEALLALTLINLRDVLGWLDKAGRRISFTTDDLPAGKDITDHIACMRNAACHVDTRREVNDAVKLHFGHLTRKGKGATIGETTLSNPCDDGVAFFYGANGIFLVRHIQRAIRETSAAAFELARQNGIIWPWR
ncbi:MAG TPA: hypothetical protein PLL33_08905 [Paracoccus sp. (in: a-proteobacteria)]|nr:hypothetical protein [Paracoccus sp. (in: a-proteobacteria)]